MLLAQAALRSPRNRLNSPGTSCPTAKTAQDLTFTATASAASLSSASRGCSDGVEQVKEES